jgi:hypothetical protein
MKILPYWTMLRSKLASELATLRTLSIDKKGRVLNWYALLDAGQLPKAYYTKMRKEIPGNFGLFKLTKEHGIEAYGPILIPVENGFNNSSVAALVRTMRYGWTVSWLSSPLSLDELAIHLAGHLNGYLDDGREVLIRYYDARLLPHFLHESDLASVQPLTQPLCHWAWWDRAMNLTVYENKCGVISPGIAITNISKKSRLVMAAAAFNDFIHAEIVKDAAEDEFANWLPHMINSAVFTQVRNAHSHGLSLLPDIHLYVSLSLRVHPEFFELLPIFKENIKKIMRCEVDMATLVLSVDATEWEALSSSGQIEIEKLRVSIGEQLCKQH